MLLHLKEHPHRCLAYAAINFGGDTPDSYSILSYTKGKQPNGQFYVGGLQRAEHPQGYTYDRRGGDGSSFASISTNPTCACLAIVFAPPALIAQCPLHHVLPKHIHHVFVTSCPLCACCRRHVVICCPPLYSHRCTAADLILHELLPFVCVIARNLFPKL